jgi:hypothetical protein
MERTAFAERNLSSLGRTVFPESTRALISDGDFASEITIIELSSVLRSTFEI